MAKRKQNVVEIDAKVGEEIVLTTKDGGSLVVKIGNGRLVPDFASPMIDAIVRAPYRVELAASRVYHNERGGRELLSELAASLRDEAFREIDDETRETTKKEPDDDAATSESERDDQ